MEIASKVCEMRMGSIDERLAGIASNLNEAEKIVGFTMERVGVEAVPPKTPEGEMADCLLARVRFLEDCAGRIREMVERLNTVLCG